MNTNKININKINSNNKTKKYPHKNNKDIHNKNHTDNHIKDSEIKIRVSKKDKKFLQDKADALNTSLTNYILASCMSDIGELHTLIPDTVDMLNTLNDISHMAKRTRDTQFIEKTVTILNAYMQKVNQQCDRRNL